MPREDCGPHAERSPQRDEHEEPLWVRAFLQTDESRPRGERGDERGGEGFFQDIGLGEGADVAWLAKRHAVTILPAVSSLRALRRFARPTPAREPFGGFGDPLLGGEGARKRN